MHSRIAKIDYYLPKRILDNKDLEKELGAWSAEKIEEKVGIRQRHITTQDETALDMAYEAASKVLEGYNKDDIGFLLLCTQSPDFFLPTSACILQDKLGLKTSCGAIDFNLGCSGFVYGLTLAKGLIATGVANKVLLITSETYSKYIHPMDKGNRSIFGDGAAATIIEKSDIDGIKGFILGTDGSGYANLIVRNGALRHPEKDNPESVIDDDGTFNSPDHLYMDGSEIFNFTIDIIPDLVQDILKANNLLMEDVDYFIFHQANKFILDYLRDYLDIPVDKFYLNMLFTGNTVSATIPIALVDCLSNKIVKPGDKIMLVGFGVGLSWGGCIIEI